MRLSVSLKFGQKVSDRNAVVKENPQGVGDQRETRLKRL